VNPAARRAAVRRLADAGIRAVDPKPLLLAALSSSSPLESPSSKERTFVIAAGKAAVPMFQAYEQWAGSAPRKAVIAAPASDLPPRPGRDVIVAGHPRPTRASLHAAQTALRLADETLPNDRLTVLLSGGASAMLSAPAPPVSLDDKIALTQWALSRGLAIDSLNAVRKHLSLIKGGLLATAARGTVETWALSDVHQPFDDDPSTIGSGPTVPDPSTYADAWDILSRLDARWCDIHQSVAARLDAGRRGGLAETPKPGDDRLRRSSYRVIGNRHTAMAGAQDAATKEGLAAVVQHGAVWGDARTAAVRFVRDALASTASMPGPCCVLASGETTVDVRGNGRGGRNQEFALAAAIEIARSGTSATVAAVGTDGVDGPTDAAGAVADESTASRAVHAGIDPGAMLDANDSFTFFMRLGDLIVTGPTGTNVGDLLIFVRG